MNRALLNEVKFKTPYNKVVMKQSKRAPASSDPIMKGKLARILFFWVLVFVVLFTAKLVVEYSISFCWGVPHMNFSEIVQEFNKR